MSIGPGGLRPFNQVRLPTSLHGWLNIYLMMGMNSDWESTPTGFHLKYRWGIADRTFWHGTVVAVWWRQEISWTRPITQLGHLLTYMAGRNTRESNFPQTGPHNREEQVNSQSYV